MARPWLRHQRLTFVDCLGDDGCSMQRKSAQRRLKNSRWLQRDRHGVYHQSHASGSQEPTLSGICDGGSDRFDPRIRCVLVRVIPLLGRMVGAHWKRGMHLPLCFIDMKLILFTLLQLRTQLKHCNNFKIQKKMKQLLKRVGNPLDIVFVTHGYR